MHEEFDVDAIFDVLTNTTNQTKRCASSLRCFKWLGRCQPHCETTNVYGDVIAAEKYACQSPHDGQELAPESAVPTSDLAP